MGGGRCASIARTISESVASLTKQQEFGFCDGVRAIAVLWVTAAHGIKYVSALWGEASAEMFKMWWPVATLCSGEVGVDLFLVLSGFLIGGSMEREYGKSGGIAIGRFAVRRIFRIFPAIYGAMAATVVADHLAGDPAECPSQEWFVNLYLFNNLLPWSTSATCLRQTWSVSLELQLYMCTPVLFTLASLLGSISPRFSRTRWSIALSALGVLGCAATRLYFILKWDMVANKPNVFVSLFHFYFPTQFRYSTYLCGVIAGIIVQDRKTQEAKKAKDPVCFLETGSREVSESGTESSVSGSSSSRADASAGRDRWINLALVSCLAILLATTVYGGDLQTVDDPLTTEWFRKQLPVLATLQMALLRPLTGVATSGILLLCSSGCTPRLAACLSNRFLRPIAGLSYSMYLMQFVGFHLFAKPFLHALAGPVQGAPQLAVIALAYVAVVLFVLGSIPLALLSYTLVERPGIEVGKLVLQLPARCAGRPEAKKGVGAAPSPSPKMVGKNDSETSLARLTSAGSESENEGSASDDRDSVDHDRGSRALDV